MGGSRPTPAPTPRPAPVPVVEPVTVAEAPSEILRRKRRAEGRTDVVSTTGEANGASKQLLGQG